MITWTTNSTNNDNRWTTGQTAEWTATGDLPAWVAKNLSNVKPVFIFSQQPEIDSLGDTYTGTGSVTYDNQNKKLTIRETINYDVNNWTVQIHEPDGTGVLRWPGWGAVSARWADPGCVAWDDNDGDVTHLITRKIELKQGADWSYSYDD